MDHFKILKRAWDIVWKYRALWLIGLILVLVGGGVAGLQGTPSGGSPGSGGSSSSGGQPESDGGQWPGPQTDWPTFWDKVMPIIIIIAIVLLAIFFLFIVLGIIKFILRWMTRTSLIEMVQHYEETGEQVGFWAGLRLGWSRSAFNLFLVNLLLRLPLLLLGLLGALLGTAIAIIIVVIIITTLKSGGGGVVAAAAVFAIAAIFVGIVLLLPLILIGIVLRVVVSLVSEIAFRASIIERQGAWEAIKTAIALIRRNLWPAVLQYLLILGLGIAWNMATLIVNLPLILLAMVVAGLPSLVVGGLVGIFGGPIAGVVLGLILFVPLMILIIGLPNLALNTFATVYHSTVWTLTYRELCAIDVGKEETELLEVKAPDVSPGQ